MVHSLRLAVLLVLALPALARADDPYTHFVTSEHTFFEPLYLYAPTGPIPCPGFTGGCVFKAGDLVVLGATVAVNGPVNPDFPPKLQVTFIYDGSHTENWLVPVGTASMTRVAPRDGRLVAFFPNVPGDPTATVVVDINRLADPTARWTPGQKALLAQGAQTLAYYTFVFGTLAPFPIVGKAAALMASVTGAAGFVVGVLALDPPDPNFTEIAEPVELHIPLPPDLDALEAAYIRNQLDFLALMHAMIITHDRAEGARLAGATEWATTQANVLEAYKVQWATLFTEWGRLIVQRQTTWPGEPVTVTPATVEAFKASLATGWPGDFAQVFAQLGMTLDQQDALRARVLALEPAPLVGEYPAALTPPAFYATLQGAVRELGDGTQQPPAPPGTVAMTVLDVISNSQAGKPVAVSILSAPGFDATAVEEASITFGRTGTEAVPTRCTVQDGNLVCRFRSRDTQLQVGDTEARLSLTYQGAPHVLVAPVEVTR